MTVAVDFTPGAEMPLGGDQQVDEHHMIGKDLQRMAAQQAQERPVEKPMEETGSGLGAGQARLPPGYEQPADEIGQRCEVHDEKEAEVLAFAQHVPDGVDLGRQIAPPSKRSHGDDRGDDAPGGDGGPRAVGPHHAVPVDPAGGGERAQNETGHERHLPGERVEEGPVVKTRLQRIERGIHAADDQGTPAELRGRPGQHGEPDDQAPAPPGRQPDKRGRHQQIEDILRQDVHERRLQQEDGASSRRADARLG